MVVAAWRHQDMMAMATERWVKKVAPKPDTLGSVLRRMRKERGLPQAGTAGRRQSEWSQWEADTRIPSAIIIDDIERAFGVPKGTLQPLRSEAELERQRRLREVDDSVRAEEDAETDDPYGVLPGPAYAVPDEPGMYEVLTEVIAFDDLEQVKTALRTFRTRPETLDAFRTFLNALQDEYPDDETAAQLMAADDEITDTLARANPSATKQRCSPSRAISAK